MLLYQWLNLRLFFIVAATMCIGSTKNLNERDFDVFCYIAIMFGIVRSFCWCLGLAYLSQIILACPFSLKRVFVVYRIAAKSLLVYAQFNQGHNFLLVGPGWVQTTITGTKNGLLKSSS